MRKRGLENEGERDRKWGREGYKMRERGIENEGERDRKLGRGG